MARRLARAAAVALAAAGIALGALALGVLDGLDGQATDARFALRGERPVRDVAVVAIDDTSFGELKRRWPFPRSLHARVIDRLRAAGARQIAYDVQFTEPTSPGQDGALYDAVARARHVVLSTTEVGAGGATDVLGGDENLRRAGARAGHTGAPAESDGIIRRVEQRVDGLESFPVAAAEAATGRRIRDGALRDGRALIDFSGGPGTVPSLSFSRVLSGRFDPALVRGRVVVVGASAPSLQDVHHTSTAREQVMSGPELQAAAISTALRGFPLRSAPPAVSLIGLLLLALAAPLASLRLRPLAIGLIAAGALAAYAVAAQLLFEAGLVVWVAAPVLALALGTLGALGLRLAAEGAERRRTREAFARFVPESVVKELVDHGEGGRRLPARRLEATVLFCDLRGFTALAESVSAERVMELLDRYLTAMSEAVLDNGGTVVSFMGDGLMAVFGSPIARDDHAVVALAAAREMLERRLPAFNTWLAASGLTRVRMGVGLNSGPVMSGTVGSDRRLEYAAVGDTTNVAARIEGMTKDRGGGLLLSGATYELLGDAAQALQPAGVAELRGRAEAVELWTLRQGRGLHLVEQPASEPSRPAAS
jgi:adenylate cyclase